MDTSAITGAPPLDRIRAGILGEGQVLDGPYGPRRITYADYTASGRALDFVEEFIRLQVLPRYANTHTESSATGAWTSGLREQARRLIRDSVGGSEDDLVIFCGSGATAAVTKLVGILGLALPTRHGSPGHVLPAQRPVVFVGPYEHHSNELPWRESIADVVVIDEDANGHVDLAHLADRLIHHAERPMRIGSFSAASNVTGILTDVDQVAALLHEHGALSFWDYAAAGPYVPIRVRESAPGAGDHKDAVFLSPHKFIGGPQTPGVLVVRRDLVTNPVPTAPGGGTVSFVGPTTHRYLDDPVAREEGGTPAIVESIRAGLAFAVKDSVGTDLIREAEERHWRHATARWGTVGDIEVLGDPDADRLPIASFRIRDGAGYLHHNFVVAVLNDLFGVQARGGCSCAGPYGHRLLSIDAEHSRAYDHEAGLGCHGVKPGWARITFHYAISDAVRDFLVEAVVLLARYGRRLLPDYTFEPDSGTWRHRSAAAAAPAPDLRQVAEGAIPPLDHRHLGEEILAEHLRDARLLLAARSDHVDDGPTGLPDKFEALRWFPLPPACLAG